MKKITLLSVALTAFTAYSQSQVPNKSRAHKAQVQREPAYKQQANENKSPEKFSRVYQNITENKKNKSRPLSDAKPTHNFLKYDSNSYYYVCSKCGNESSSPMRGSCPAGGGHSSRRRVNF